MSSTGNPYSLARANVDAHRLVKLGIPPDQAIKIAARARALQSAMPMPGLPGVGSYASGLPTEQPFPSPSGARPRTATDLWAGFSNVDERSLSAANRESKSGPTPAITNRAARELHPDAPNWYGEHSHWQPHWDGKPTMLSGPYGRTFYRFHSNDPFQLSNDGGETWRTAVGGNAYGFGLDPSGDIRTFSGDRVEFRPLMTS